jgi:RNA polymerase-binding transcription factor DksA
MEHATTDTDTAALLAEVDALLEQAAATDARVEALLRTGSPAVRMADLALQMELGRQELDQIEREQAAIEAAINALEAP